MAAVDPSAPILGMASLDLGTFSRDHYGYIFRFLRRERWTRDGMKLNIGMIRDRQGIYSGLLQSQSMNRQLAVCFNSNGKLFVKISVVKEIITMQDGVTVVLGSADDPQNETAIPLDEIRSIYPISDFEE